jgi:YhcH/YjgK/YiaL family protein
MFFGNLNQVGIETIYPPPIRTALEYLKTHDCTTMQPGVYEIDGKNLYAQVMDAQTDTVDRKKPEIHRQYVDLQYAPGGNEKIGVAVDSGKNIVAENLFEERDILFYKEVPNESFITMEAGSFAVFFPWDIHRPACAINEPATIRKVVVKIRLSLFE